MTNDAAFPAPNVSSLRRRSDTGMGIFDWGLALLGGLSVAFRWGTNYNVTVYLLVGLAKGDPHVLVGDWYARETTNHHILFEYFVSILSRLGTPYVLAMITQKAMIVLFSLSIILICKQFFSFPRVVFAMFILHLQLIPWLPWIGLGNMSFLYADLCPSHVAACLLMLGVSILFRRHWLLSGILVGVGGAFSVSYLMCFAPIVFFIAVERGVLSSKGSLLRFAVPVLVAWGGVMIHAGVVFYQQSPVNAEIYAVIPNFIGSRHFAIESWHPLQTTMWGLLVAVGVCASFRATAGCMRPLRLTLYATLGMTALACLDLWLQPLPIITTFHLWRIAPLAWIVASLFLFDLVARIAFDESVVLRPLDAPPLLFSAFLIVDSFFSLSYMVVSDSGQIAPHVIRSIAVRSFFLFLPVWGGIAVRIPPFRLWIEGKRMGRLLWAGGCIGVGVSVLILWRWQFNTLPHWMILSLAWLPFCLSLAMWGFSVSVILPIGIRTVYVVVLFLMIGWHAHVQNGLLSTDTRTPPRASAEWSLVEWVRLNTVPGDVFVIPPPFHEFRLWANRAVVVDMEVAPYFPGGLQEWYRRLLDVCGLDPSSVDIRERFGMEGAVEQYHQIDDNTVARLKESYGIDYLVVEHVHRQKGLLNYPEVFRNEHYSVYRIDGLEPSTGGTQSPAALP